MKKSNITLIAIYSIAAALVLYFAYGAVKNRYFKTDKNNVGTKNSETQNQINQPVDGTENINQENNVPEDAASATENGQPVFENADCANDCARFKDVPDGLKYCQEACGDRPITPKNSASQCENLAGIEKDGCWRDLAVSKKDFAVCDKISDAKLLKVCKNRVTEEVLN
ncbi:MAG: hypothetical protein WC726_00670 [Parcubacteria group bacterium]|jgi:hypothetical protein